MQWHCCWITLLKLSCQGFVDLQHIHPAQLSTFSKSSSSQMCSTMNFTQLQPQSSTWPSTFATSTSSTINFIKLAIHFQLPVGHKVSQPSAQHHLDVHFATGQSLRGQGARTFQRRFARGQGHPEDEDVQGLRHALSQLVTGEPRGSGARDGMGPPVPASHGGTPKTLDGYGKIPIQNG